VSREIELSWACPTCANRNLGRFMACQQCGAPKPADVQYDMPADTTAAPSVDDDKLLWLAKAGPNWKCTFCGSDQRKVDGACAQCGAPSQLSPQPVIEEPSVGTAPDLMGDAKWLMWPRIGILGFALFAALGGLIFYFWYRGHEHEYKGASVSAVHWTQSIVVEKYKVWEREGFRHSLSDGAFDVVSLGQQIEGYDQIPDGYDTQTITTQVSCGQTCTDSAPICHESCTNSRNGFASCHQECSGGGHSCTPKYCSQTHTQQVPRFRQQARYAEAVKYKIWDWGDDRTVSSRGSNVTDLRWPVEEAHVGEHLADREQERERREATYEVTIGYGDKKSVTFPCPRSQLSRFAIGSTHEVDVQGDTVLVDHLRVDPVTAKGN